MRVYSLPDNQNVRHVNSECHSWKSWTQRPHVLSQAALLDEARHSFLSGDTGIAPLGPQQPCCAPSLAHPTPFRAPGVFPYSPRIPHISSQSRNSYSGSKQSFCAICEFPQPLASSGKLQTQAAHLPQPTRPHHSLCKQFQENPHGVLGQRQSFPDTELAFTAVPCL